MSRDQEAPLASRECTLALVKGGYHYIGEQCDRLGTDIFRSRLLLKNTLFLRGEEAAKLFYDASLMSRENAAPKRLQKTLFGEGGIQGLDDAPHHRRKALFLSLMSQERIDWLMQLVEQYWQSRMGHWEDSSSIVLLDEFHLILCRAACDWCGIPLREEDAPALAQNLVLLIEGGGAIGPKHWASRRARRMTENALVPLIEEYRHRPNDAERTLPLAEFANFRDAQGMPLPSRIVAVELLNLIRPIVAVARYMVFAVKAMHEHPSCRERLKQDNATDYRRYFIQEVRRYYPFFPFLAARIKKDFTWHGYRFHRGWRLILDLYGTNHDPARWEAPEHFRPERFEQETGDFHRFAMIPQGGSEYATQHRCPGEWITLALIDLTIEKFTRQLCYRVPPQDLALDPSSMPARPRSGLIVDNVRPIGERLDRHEARPVTS